MSETANPAAFDELQKLPIADQVDAPLLQRLARAARLERFDAGAIIQRDEDAVDALRFVVSGRIALELRLPGKTDLAVGSLSYGQILGWSALLQRATSEVTARAVKPTVCVAVPTDAVIQACDRDPVLGHQLLRLVLAQVAHRLRDAHVQLLDVFGQHR